MGTITSVVLGVTFAGMLFGALFGFIRGRERALLRLVLVVISAILAISLRGTIVDSLMNANIGGASLKETLMESFLSTDGAIPASLMNLIFSLIEIIIGFFSYFILLFALRGFTLVFVFPFLKILIRKVEMKYAMKRAMESVSQSGASTQSENTESTEEDNSENTEGETESAAENEEPQVHTLPDGINCKAFVKKHKGMGALVGLAQGFLLAYFLFAPITCLATQVDSITSMKIGGESIVEIPDEVGLSEYANSGIGKFYSSTGRWCYNILTSTTDADGNKVSLAGILDSVGVILEVADVATSLEDDFKILTDENAEPEEVITALDNLGDKLISVGNSMEKLDDDTVNMIKDLVTDLGGEDIPQEEIDEILDKLDPEFFVSAGNGVKAFAEYEQIKLDGDELTEDQAKGIIDKAQGCISIVESVGTVEVSDADKAQFKTAIDSSDSMSKEDKDAFYKLFGIQAPSMP